MTTQLKSIQEIADVLVHARREGVQPAAASIAHPPESEEAAYAVQARVAQALKWFDTVPPLYWKSGGPAKDKPVLHAPLPPQCVFESPADLSHTLLFAPGIEAEVALLLGQDVTAEAVSRLQRSEVEPLIDAMAVSVEVVDSRWVEGSAAPALLRLADQQAHGALVLGAWQPYERWDWAAQTCHIRIGTAEAVIRQGSHAYGDPLWGVLEWLRHVTRHGDTVPAGTVVTTGTWCGVLPAERGDTVEVSFDGLGLAALRL